MLKLDNRLHGFAYENQPPSGGCVLKPEQIRGVSEMVSQPPSGGCVLKHICRIKHRNPTIQPPSGGCVLKQAFLLLNHAVYASSRLQAAVC